MAFLNKHVVFVSIIFTFFLIHAAQGIAGGTTQNPCDYPGVAAVEVQSSDIIACHGVIQNETLYLPELCSTILAIESASSNITIHYGDGTSVYNIPTSPLSGSMVSGIYRVEVPGISNTSPCEESATFFMESTHTLDTSSCEVVGYGPSTPTSTSYTGVLNAASVNKSTSAGCCDHVIETYTDVQQGLTSSTGPKNCLQSTGSTCGVAELGAPIYCDTTDGEKVVIGLSSAVPCTPGSVFTAHDLTSSSDQVKFGISA